MNTIEIIQTINDAAELCACITAFACRRKLRGTAWQWLPFYLLFIVALETAGRLLSQQPHLYIWNANLYRYIGFPGQFLFFFFILYHQEAFKQRRAVVYAALVLYIISILVNVFIFCEKGLQFFPFSYTAGCLLLLVLLIIYYYWLTQPANISGYAKRLDFWFCCGLLLYYIGTLPFWALRNYLAYKHRDVFEFAFYVWPFMSMLMYLVFIIGLIWAKPK